MSKTIEIPLGKKKIVLLLIATLGFVVASVWFIINPGKFNIGIFGIENPEIIRLVGIVGVLFFGAAAIFGTKKLFSKKAGLIINERGIVDHTNATSVGLIAWQDITNIRSVTVMTTKFLLIDVKNPNDYISKAGKFKGRLMKANMKSYGTPLSITINTLAYRSGNLEELLISKWELYRN